VQAHEGKVWVRSKSGQGCTFVVRIRKAAEESIAAQPAQITAALPESSKAERAHA
jgi:hypothetical protein